MITAQTNKQTNKQTSKQTNKQTNKQAKIKQKKQTMQQGNVYMYSSNPRQRKMFDEVYCCVCKIIQNIGILAKDFIQHTYYESMFSFLFLHSL